MDDTFLFTSESVSEGHPDKIADQIADAILDAILRQDRYAHVACEVVLKAEMVLIAGEISSTSSIDIEPIVRSVIHDIGYTHADMGLDAALCSVVSEITTQSPDIAQGINKSEQKAQGAGDQGMMFGYANNDTDAFMPAPIYYAHRLMQQQAKLRKSKKLPWLRPDAKAQLTFQYENNRPKAITSVVLSTQHDPEIKQAMLREAVIEEIIKPILPATLIKKTEWLINPTGRFVIGGPQGDCGLTGRKLMVDTYGSFARHGGGSFSGKDASKVDRSAAYAARYAAKNIVAAGLAERCEIQLAYAIGIANPIAIFMDTFHTSKIDPQTLLNALPTVFDLRPFGIISMLDLLRPIYQATASYGHFGREDLALTWEKLDKVEALRAAIKGA